MNNDIILLFDLDDTLVVEKASAFDALSAAAAFLLDNDIEPDEFARTVKECANDIWQSLPPYPYCQKIGISSWEGLWANFYGDHPELARLRALKEQYHTETWTAALQVYGIDDTELAVELSRRYNIERRKRHIRFPESLQVLSTLRGTYRMGLITNGTPDLQWEKINGGGVKPFFDTIIVAGEVDVAKPKKEIFDHAFRFFGVEKHRYLMIGNSLKHDIGGAYNAGIRSVWVNRTGKANDSEHQPDFEISSLDELIPVLNTM